MNFVEMTQVLGNLGEFFGAVAVFVTLVYLSVQIRQNTRSMDASRQLAMAQVYQTRATVRFQATALHANFGELEPIRAKLEADGIGALTAEEQARYRTWCTADQIWFDNLHYQYSQGLLDNEYYEMVFKPGVRISAEHWRLFGIEVGRPSFVNEVRRILDEVDLPAPVTSVGGTE